jgi:hypothetical protein
MTFRRIFLPTIAIIPVDHLSDCLVLIIAAGTRSVAVESTSHILNFHKENNQSKTPVRCFVRNQSGQKKDISEYFLTDNCHLSNCLVDIILAGARTGQLASN